MKVAVIHGSGANTLKVSNKEMNGYLKIVQGLEDSGILLQRTKMKIFSNVTGYFMS